MSTREPDVSDWNGTEPATSLGVSLVSWNLTEMVSDMVTPALNLANMTTTEMVTSQWNWTHSANSTDVTWAEGVSVSVPSASVNGTLGDSGDVNTTTPVMVLPDMCQLSDNVHSCLLGAVSVVLCVMALLDLSANKTVSGYTTVLFANLFVVDLFAGLFTILTWVSPCITWAGLCRMFFTAANIHVLVNCISVLLITLSRVLLLVKGMAFKRMATTKGTVWLVLVTWFVVVTGSMLWVLLRPGSSGYLGCQLHIRDNVTAHVIIVPVTFGALCPMYGFIVHRVRKHIQRVAVAPHPAVMNLPQNPSLDKETKVSVTALLVITSFGVCYLPGVFYLLYLYFGSASPDTAVTTFTTAITASHSITNPLIYGWRIGKKRCLRRQFLCQSQSGDSTAYANRNRPV